jgi:Na+/melibiose symporter-like transporter
MISVVNNKVLISWALQRFRIMNFILDCNYMNGDLFTTESLLSLGGASFAVVLVTNVVQYICNWNPKWLGFAIAMIVSAMVVCLIEEKTWVVWVVGFFNGFLIYANAVGLAQISGTKEKPRERGTGAYGQVEGQERVRRKWPKWY